jgi:hypothetical protein
VSNQGLNLGLTTSTFTGATNLTQSYGAPMFASNGNFYQVSDVVAESLPTDTDGVPFYSSADRGESWIIIDALSGTTLRS